MYGTWVTIQKGTLYLTYKHRRAAPRRAAPTMCSYRNNSRTSSETVRQLIMACASGWAAAWATASRAQHLEGASIGQRQRHSGGRLQTDETKLQRHESREPCALHALQPTGYGRVGGHLSVRRERSKARAKNTNKQTKQNKKAAGTPTNTQRKKYCLFLQTLA